MILFVADHSNTIPFKCAICDSSGWDAIGVLRITACLDHMEHKYVKWDSAVSII